MFLENMVKNDTNTQQTFSYVTHEKKFSSFAIRKLKTGNYVML